MLKPKSMFNEAKHVVLRRTFLLIAALIFIFSAYGQVEAQDTISTIDNNSDSHKARISGVASISMSFGEIGNDFAHMMGGSLGIIINDFFIGGYGMGKTNSISYLGDRDKYDLGFGHGGFWLGYTFFHNKAIHPVLQSQVGWGSISAKEKSTDFNVDFSDGDQIFIINPILEIEFNFSRFFKVALGGNYPLIYNIEADSPYEASDFRKPAVFLSFKFGWFE